MIGHTCMVGPSPRAEGLGAVTDSSPWNEMGASLREPGKDPGAGPDTQEDSLRNELHLHVSLFEILPGAPQTTDECLCKYNFTRLHNLCVKWGQFPHEVHKPALQQF